MNRWRLLLCTPLVGLLLSAAGTLSSPPAAASPVAPKVTFNTNAGLGDSPDPDIVHVGSTFYAFTTGTTWGNQIGIAETTNTDPLFGWTHVGSAFPEVPYFDPLAPWEQAQTTTSPGVFHYNNEWIMYYDANTTQNGRTCLSVATASSVTGPYSDTSSGPIVCQLNLGGSLDPQPFVDPATGNPYLLWKSNDGSSPSASQVWSQPIGPNGVSLVGSPSSIFTIASGPYPWQATTDNPSMAYAGGTYYLFFSGGNYQSNWYPTGYVVCSGPSGGCDQNEPSDPILNDFGGSGGGQPFTDAAGNWWLSSQTWSPTSCTNYGCGGTRQMHVAALSLPGPPPTITTGTFPTAGTGTPYTLTLAASGTAPFTWSKTGGALPAGLQLNASTGIVSGTPTATGTGSVTFQVADTYGQTGTVTLPWTVKPGSVTTPMVDPASTTLGTSVTYSVTVSPFSGGGTPTGTVTFTIGTTTMCTTTALSGGTASCTSTLAPPGADTVTATYPGDSTFASSVGTTDLVIPSGAFTPLSPTRICDTRSGNPSGLSGPAALCNGHTLATGATLPVNVANAGNSGAGSFGVPANATAAVLNVTVVNPGAAGYVTVFPTGATQPLASNINYVAGEVVPNLVEVGIGTGGDISVYSSASTDLVIDVEGYTSLAGSGLYTPLGTPVRICDTRPGNPSRLAGLYTQCSGGNSGRTLHAGSPLSVTVAGNSYAVPTTATAVVLNVSAVSGAGAGYITVYPGGTPQPLAANVNYGVAQVVANRVIVPLGSGGATGTVTVSSSATADIIVDVSGYYSGSGSQFVAEGAPVRICDTRPGNPSNLMSPYIQCNGVNNGGKTIGSNSSLPVNVRGLAQVPSDATAVVINLTGVAPSTLTFLTVFPVTLPQPLVSDLNPAAGEVRANLVVATLSPTGTINIYNDTGSVNVVVDVLGWYA